MRINPSFHPVTDQDQPVFADGCTMRLVADEKRDVMTRLGKSPAKVGAKRPDTNNHDPHEALPSRDSVPQDPLAGKPKALAMMAPKRICAAIYISTS